MKNSIAILIFLMATQASASVWDRTEALAKCAAYDKELKSWGGSLNRDASQVVLSTDQVQRALVMIAGIDFPSESDVQSIKSEMTHASFGDETHLKYFKVAPSDCPPVRLMLGKMLTNTSVRSSPREQEEIAAALKKMVSATKYPTFLDVAIDAIVLRAGIDHGLWKSSTADKMELSNVQAGLKEARAQWTSKFGAAVGRLAEAETTGGKSSARDMQIVSTGLIAEKNQSAEFFTQLQKVAAKVE